MAMFTAGADRKRFWRSGCCLCFPILLHILSAVPGRAQTLGVSSATGTPGEAMSVIISLDLPGGTRPTTLGWDTVFPSQLLEIEGEPAGGASLNKLKKSLTCACRNAYSYRCIITGGSGGIENGPVAMIRFRIKTDARPGLSAIRIDHAEAVSGDSRSKRLTGVDGVVDIR